MNLTILVITEIMFVKIDSSSSKSSHQRSAATRLLLELSILTKITTIITNILVWNLACTQAVLMDKFANILRTLANIAMTSP